MSRTLRYFDNVQCDNCGRMGATDFMGDYFCDDCTVTCEKCESVFIKDLKRPSEKKCGDCRSPESEGEKRVDSPKTTDKG